MGLPVQPGLMSDAFAAMDAGMNSDVPPVSLPKNQASMLTNCTVRGRFVTQRSAFRDLTLSFDNLDVQANFETGLFQEGGYYKPDFGPESVVAVVSGKFFKLTPVSTSADVVDISAPTDNSTEVQQQWMWQGEQFLIINDGFNAPAIYDGITTVRAKQGELIATITNTWAMPAEGASVGVTFSTTFTGPFNVPLYAYSGTNLLGTFEVNQQATGSEYSARLTNIDDVQGTLHPSGSDIEIVSAWSGTSVTAGTPTQYTGQSGTLDVMQQNSTPNTIDRQEYQRQTVQVDPPYTGPVNSRVVFPTINREKEEFVALECVVVAVNTAASTIRVDRDDGPSPNNLTVVSIPAGVPIQRMNTQPNQLVAITTQNFNAPEIGQYVDVTVDRLITVSGQIVYINGKRYSISPSPITGGTSFYLKAINPLESSGETIQAGATLRTIPQLPPGRVGVYGLGRNWVCLADGKSYLASDIVGGSSGAIAYNFRDSILNVTENNYLAGGGVFRVPSTGLQINAMAFPATLDSSLGQGALQVGTQSVTFSCNAPIQRLEWQNLTNPIQTQSLVGGGSLGAFVPVNGDLWFRSLDGIRSLKLARQDFQVSYSNTPQSTEMNRILLDDNRGLLNFWHGVVFDNRLISTANPQTSTRGVFHDKIIALNLDPNSSLREKLPPVYDGVWQGRNVLKIVSGEFSGVQRTFAFIYNEDTEKIGLTEIMTTPNEGSASNKFDNNDERIQWSFESPALFYQEDTRNRKLLKLSDGELIVKDLLGTVQFSVYYRPDYLSDWTLWHNWEVSDSPNYQPRMGLGTPPITGDDSTGRPNCVGYHFQFKVVVKGPCVIMGLNAFATVQPVTDIAPPISSSGELTPLT